MAKHVAEHRGSWLLARAGWWIADYLYAGAWQLRAFLSRARPASFASGTGRAVLILPGVYESWRFMLPLVRELHGQGHPVHVLPALGSNRASVQEAARTAERYLMSAELHDVVIVAHSKGGLVGKQLMAFGPAATRIRAMVAIATPFAGSRYADFMLNKTLRSFSPGNETLLALGRSLEVNARIVSVSPRFDPHIPEGSDLAGARNVHAETAGHFRILADQTARAAALATAAGRQPVEA